MTHWESQVGSNAGTGLPLPLVDKEIPSGQARNGEHEVLTSQRLPRLARPGGQAHPGQEKDNGTSSHSSHPLLIWGQAYSERGRARCLSRHCPPRKQLAPTHRPGLGVAVLVFVFVFGTSRRTKKALERSETGERDP